MKVINNIFKSFLKYKYKKAVTEEKEQLLIDTIDENRLIMLELKERLVELYGHTSIPNRH